MSLRNRRSTTIYIFIAGTATCYNQPKFIILTLHSCTLSLLTTVMGYLGFCTSMTSILLLSPPRCCCCIIPPPPLPTFIFDPKSGSPLCYKETKQVLQCNTKQYQSLSFRTKVQLIVKKMSISSMAEMLQISLSFIIEYSLSFAVSLIDSTIALYANWVSKGEMLGDCRYTAGYWYIQPGCYLNSVI